LNQLKKYQDAMPHAHESKSCCKKSKAARILKLLTCGLILMDVAAPY
jgi:hypothetical protein